MKNMVKLFGVIALVAVIGFSMAGCDTGGGGGSVQSSLNGTWVGEDGEELKLDNGNFEIVGQAKGTYTTSGENITITIKQLNLAGEGAAASWVSVDSAEVKQILDAAGIKTTMTGKYKVEGDTLKLTYEGGTGTFERKK